MPEPTRIEVTRAELEAMDQVEILTASTLMDVLALVLSVIQYLGFTDPSSMSLIEQLSDEYSEKLGGTLYVVTDAVEEKDDAASA